MSKKDVARVCVPFGVSRPPAFAVGVFGSRCGLAVPGGFPGFRCGLLPCLGVLCGFFFCFFRSCSFLCVVGWGSCWLCCSCAFGAWVLWWCRCRLLLGLSWSSCAGCACSFVGGGFFAFLRCWSRGLVPWVSGSVGVPVGGVVSFVLCLVGVFGLVCVCFWCCGVSGGWGRSWSSCSGVPVRLGCVWSCRRCSCRGLCLPLAFGSPPLPSGGGGFFFVSSRLASPAFGWAGSFF